MVNLAEKHDDGGGAQLADAEISRILSALHAAEFKKSETQNARVDQSFRPRSLMEIAEAARQHDEAIKADDLTDTLTDETSSDTEHQPIDELITNSDVPDEDGSGQANALPDELTISSEVSDSEIEDQSSIDVTEIDADNQIQQPKQTSPFETAQDAYDRGHSEGVNSGRLAAQNEMRAAIQAEIEEKFANKISAFENALVELTKPKAVDFKLLSHSLQEAVLRLVAERTGMIIDVLPDFMIARIDALAEAAGKKTADAHVYMHPDDCSIIAPIMASRPDQIDIEPNPDLHRGDIRIRFDGLEVDDFLELRSTLASTDFGQEEAETFGLMSADDKGVSDPDGDGSDQVGGDTSAEEAPGLMPLTSKGVSDPDGDGSDQVGGDTSAEEAPGLMPLTSKGVSDPDGDGSDQVGGDTSAEEAPGLMPLTSKGVSDPDGDGSDQVGGDTSAEEAPGLMPLTSKGISDPDGDGSDQVGGDTSAEEAPGLMPLTSKGVSDPDGDGSDQVGGDTSAEEAPGLMPLTSKGISDPDGDGSDQVGGDTSAEEAPGLMPLTSKKIDD